MSGKTWFITGASRGFGREWTLAALDRGDRVVATARDVDSLRDLVSEFGEQVHVAALDVTDRERAFAVVREGFDIFGRLDIVVNNAGYAHLGMVEELSESDARLQMDTNLFGALWVSQAAIPLLRESGGGHLVQVSSMGGICAFPGLGIYHASKWALEGMSEAMAAEVAGFGIKVTLVEPTSYATELTSVAGTSVERSEYEELRLELESSRGPWVTMPGDPAATRGAILAIVDAADPPLRVFLGNGPLDVAKAHYQERILTWDAWSAVSDAAHGAG